MVTEKQIAANRANAKRSTGPKTPEGKIRSSMNSRKHCLSAKTIVIDGEDPAEFDELLSNLFKEFNPQPGCECELVSLLAANFWRLRRVPLFEASFLGTRQSEIVHRDPRVDRLIENEIMRSKKLSELAAEYLDNQETDDDDDDDDEKRIRARFEELLPREANQPLTSPSENQEMLAKVSRYETGLMNSVTRTLNTLIGLKSMRAKCADRRRIDSRESSKALTRPPQ